MKIATIIGARPQFIKAASLSYHMSNDNSLNEILIHTGQHYDSGMSDIFFEELKIPKPKYNLGIAGGTHAGMTGRMLIDIEKVLSKESPDLTLVYGDTNSTLAGALAAVKLNIPVVHVEAGLRSYDTRMPEEINRVMTDSISDLLLCPTEDAYNNLIEENSNNTDRAFISGDVMLDSFILASGRKVSKESANKDYYLATIHRAGNTNSQSKLKVIIDLLLHCSSEMNKKIIIPLHPRTKNVLDEYNIEIPKEINLISPVGYLEMVTLLNGSSGVITDSGGLQKEAFWAKKPCVTIRENTEWVELVKLGVNKVVDTDKRLALDFLKNFKPVIFKKAEAKDLIAEYGSGEASKRILEIIKQRYN